MSGIIVNNVARASGTIAATPGGLDWSADVVTASTVTVEAGRGYFINTTSNACTVTLPASPAVGDQIVLADYARTWATNAVTLDSNGNNFQGEADTYTVDYDTVGQSLNIVYADSTKGWLPVSDDAVAITDFVPTIQRAIFAFGNTGSKVNTRNLVGTNGVVASDASGAGTARSNLAAATYGGDKAIFAFGDPAASGYTAISNLVSNTGVVGTDVSAVGDAKGAPCAVTFGTSGQALFAYGVTSENVNTRNIVSSAGVVASTVSGAGTVRRSLGGTGYGTGLGIFAFGDGESYFAISNLVNTSGVIGSDVSAVGTARTHTAGARYGSGGTALFAFGNTSGDNLINTRNLVNNVGVVASDATGAGTARYSVQAAEYGGDKAIFGFGDSGSKTGVTNLVSNSGVVATDTSAVGTANAGNSAAGYGFS